MFQQNNAGKKQCLKLWLRNFQCVSKGHILSLKHWLQMFGRRPPPTKTEVPKDLILVYGPKLIKNPPFHVGICLLLLEGLAHQVSDF